MNDLTATDLMHIFDAVLNYSAPAVQADNRALIADLDGILDKVEVELARRGYTLEHLETYTVK